MAISENLLKEVHRLTKEGLSSTKIARKLQAEGLASMKFSVDSLWQQYGGKQAFVEKIDKNVLECTARERKKKRLLMSNDELKQLGCALVENPTFPWAVASLNRADLNEVNVKAFIMRRFGSLAQFYHKYVK